MEEYDLTSLLDSLGSLILLVTVAGHGPHSKAKCFDSKTKRRFSDPGTRELSLGLTIGKDLKKGETTEQLGNEKSTYNPAIATLQSLLPKKTIIFGETTLLAPLAIGRKPGISTNTRTTTKTNINTNINANTHTHTNTITNANRQTQAN